MNMNSCNGIMNVCYLLYFIFFVEYTDASGPSDFCNNKESPVDQVPVDQNGHFIFELNQQSAPTQPPSENPNFYSH